VSKPLPPPERRKRDVTYYSVDELHELLVDDGVHHRPLGGNGQAGLQWMVDALERIAGERGISTEAAFEAIGQDIESRTGLRFLAVR
jgi:hypothetical protein